ncbi:MAG: AAA family ATPase [Oscillospiraceae bacterium]|jgi:ATP-dependent Clp protease ATP-binding subunit ClpA|nr:AAA family ATPase [Oscillospiraceae bacterium]
MLPYILSIVFTAVITLSVNYLPDIINYFSEKSSISQSKIDKNVENVAKNIKKYLEPIKGQDEVKEKITDTVVGWLQAKNEEAESNSGQRSGGLVLYFVGDSGSGKTMTAELLGRALLGGKEPTMISFSNISLSSKKSLDEQIFGKIKNVSGQITTQKKTHLRAQVENNPETVIIFDEYDKMGTFDGEKSDKMGILDNRFWDITDRGKIATEDGDIECGGLVLIVTSNEKTTREIVDDSPDKDKEKVLSENHLEPFLNRIHIFEFKPLNASAYLEILKKESEKIISNYEKTHKTKIILLESSLEIISKRMEESNHGAREMRVYMSKLRNSLLKVKDEKGALTTLEFEPELNKFIESISTDLDLLDTAKHNLTYV